MQKTNKPPLRPLHTASPVPDPTDQFIIAFRWQLVRPDSLSFAISPDLLGLASLSYYQCLSLGVLREQGSVRHLFKLS